MKRECQCPRVRHDHGTPAAYDSDGCRCLPCRAAMATLRTAWMRHYRLGEPRPTTGRLVDATGTARRLQALATLGWDAPSLAAPVGLPVSRVFQLRAGRHPTVQIRTAAQVAAAYETLSMTFRPDSREARMARNHADRNGWLPPLAWDDDTIDDPTAQPRIDSDAAEDLDEIAVERLMAGTLTVPLNHKSPELVEAIRRLAAFGMSDREIGERVGRTIAAVLKIRERNGGIAPGVACTREGTAA